MQNVQFRFSFYQKRHFFILGLLLIGINSFAQRVNMQNYTMEDGLVANPILCIYQDKYGFMWFGTPYGLSKYNGYTFTNYTHRNGLSSDIISALFEDENGDLNLSNGNGQTDKFVHGNIEKNVLKESMSLVRAYPQTDGSVHGVSAEGKVLKIAKGQVTSLLPQLKGYVSSYYRTLNKNWVLAGQFSENNIYTTSLLILDKTGKKLAQAETGIPYEVFNIYPDDKDRIWICSGHGLKMLTVEDANRGNPVLTPLPFPFDSPYLEGVVLDMIRDKSGNYWIASFQGLIKITPEGKLTRFTTKDGLASNNVRCLYEDVEGNLWIGTTKGVTKIPAGSNVQYFTTADGLGDNDIQSVLALNDDEIYYATVNGLLQKFNSKTLQVSTLYEKGPGRFLLERVSNQRIYVSVGDERWSATQLYYFNPKTGIGDKILHSEYMFFCVEADEKGNLFLGTNHGIYIYHVETKQTYFLEGINERVNFLLFDSRKNLWVSTHSGKAFKLTLSYINQKLSAHVESLSAFFPDQDAGRFLLDSDNNIWAGSRRSGVMRFSYDDSGKLKSLRILPEDGLMSILNRPALEDKYGNLFLTSQLGIDKLVRVKNDEYRVYNFGKQNHFYDEIWSIDITPNQVFWVGTSSGLVRYTDAGTEMLTAPKVFITQILRPSEKYYRSVDPEKELILPYDQNYIQIEFSSPSYVNENELLYSYRLLGNVSEAWSEPSTEHKISFAGLKAGKYRFEVKTVRWDGISGEPESFSFTISSPWWQTWWFLALFFTLIALLIFLLIRKRIENIRFKASIKQKITEAEMMALKAQMNPHFIFNCINNIDAFIQNNDKYNATMYLNKFARLLRNVLDYSEKNVVPFAEDLETLKLYIELERLRDQQKFSVIYTIDDSLNAYDYKVPPLVVQPFVENAIIHGLRVKDANDKKLSVSVKREAPDYILYTIEDNGVGRNTEKPGVLKNRSHYGMKMAMNRVRYFNREEKSSVIVTDLFRDGKPAGTKVEVKLKVE